MKKLLSLILAAVLLSLPVLSMAEGALGFIGGADGPANVVVTNMQPSRLQNALDAGRRVETTIALSELTGVETGDPMADTAIADLVQALAITGAAQGDEVNLALTVSGQDVLTLGGAISGEDVYLSSNLLGGTMVVGMNEFEPLINKLLDMFVLMEAMTEEDAAMLREEVAAMKVSFEEMMAEETAEELIIDQMNYASLETLVSKIERKFVKTTNIIVPRMCDPAVSGVSLVADNGDVNAGLKLLLQFLLDNPMLLEYMATSMGYPTEAQLNAQWEASGELYTTFGIYESKDAFMADQVTIDSVIRQAMQEIDKGDKLLAGNFTMNVFLDEQDLPVYATATLPLIIDSETAETTTINWTYTRQTVAQGVAHVLNVAVDDVTMTIDVLTGEGSTTVTMTGVAPDSEPVTLFELSFKEAASESNPDVTCIAVDAVIYQDVNVPALVVAYDGECEKNDVRDYCAGKLILTAYDEYAGAESIAFEFNSDTAINGVDYSKLATFALDAGGVRIGLKVTEETSDPEPSIMAGNVVRPAELTDADFSNWFVGIVLGFENQLSNAMMALPESVLTWIVYSSGM